MLSFYFVDGQLSSIGYLFPVEPILGSGFDNYTDIRRAVLEKYGKPKSVEAADVQTKAGVYYRSEVLSWDNGISRVELEQFCTSLGMSCLTVYDLRLEEQRMKRVDAANKPAV